MFDGEECLRTTMLICIQYGYELHVICWKFSLKVQNVTSLCLYGMNIYYLTSAYHNISSSSRPFFLLGYFIASKCYFSLYILVYKVTLAYHYKSSSISVTIILVYKVMILCSPLEPHPSSTACVTHQWWEWSVCWIGVWTCGTPKTIFIGAIKQLYWALNFYHLF